MPQETNANKRIAKNTMFLYIQMFIVLVVSLYTSRVVLAALGITDYGVYNVVGGVVSMFTFISMAMGNATARYITFAIGKDDYEYLKKVFNTAILVHAGIALLIFVLSETVGLWFLVNKMVIPEERMFAAHCVYQLSIIAAMVTIMYVPFNAEIIAHEKMGTFAFVSVLDAGLKLLIAFLLIVVTVDKLILYGLLFLCVNLLNTTIYLTYCKRKFPETKLIFVKDLKLIKEMTSFAGWSMVGNLALICYTQGLNILLNMFFGPVVNAARGVAVQVQGAVKGFVTNFQTAVNPQLTKSYAQDDFLRMHQLLFSSSKLSFYLLYCMVLPIMLEAETILSLWLVEVPQYAASFLRLILIIMLIDTVERPVNTCMNATGDIRRYQIVSCSIQLMILPIAYLCLKVGLPPESAFIVQLLILVASFVAELTILSPKIGLSFSLYLKDVVVRILLVGGLSTVLSILIYRLLPSGITSLFVVGGSSLISVWTTAYFVGLNEPEKRFVRERIQFVVNKMRK